MWSINVNLRLLNAVNYVVDVVATVNVVVNVVVVALHVVTGVNLRLLKASVEFVWVVGRVCPLPSHFQVQLNYSVEVVLWLCCGCVVLLLGF